ncbi:MAG: NAD-dependent epimerase/dehydratase family protein [Anaerolineaceae bacterium]|jgi:dihydroflavonol-4-reductase|nr:NAD-dependent epimerase/dehydratase family protein [Anaerolineaceae bacterium]
MHVLLTGATGLVGSHLCRALLAQGETVRVFRRASSSLRLLDGLDVEHAIGDLNEPESIEAAMRGVEVVYHAAGVASSQSTAGRMYTVMVEGTRSLLQAALEAGVQRVVYSSCVTALGVPEASSARQGQPVLLDEHHTWNFRGDRWPIGYTKYMAEMEVQKAVARGLDVVTVNPGFIIGAQDIHRQTHSLVVQIARQKLPFLISGGFNFVHVLDVVEGHLAAMRSGHCGERYIIGGENLSYIAFARKVAEIAGVNPPVLVLPGGVAGQLVGPFNFLQRFMNLPVGVETLNIAGQLFFYDNRKSRTELGLKAPRPIEAAIKEALDWHNQGEKPVVEEEGPDK